MLLQLAQLKQQRGNVILNDAPQGVIVDAKISVDEPVARGNDQSPWDVCMLGTHGVGYVRRRFSS